MYYERPQKNPRRRFFARTERRPRGDGADIAKPGLRFGGDEGDGADIAKPGLRFGGDDGACDEPRGRFPARLMCRRLRAGGAREASSSGEAGSVRGNRRRAYLRAAAAVLALAMLTALALYALPVGFFGFHNRARYLANGDLPSGRVHVLLMGIDRDKAGTSRADTMMVLTVGGGRAYLTSLQRDTGVTIPGKSGLRRLNAAYAYGGAELALQTVNQNFGLNITRYALVDYESFPELIDLIGGVTVTVTDDEAKQIDNNMREVLVRAYKTGAATYDAALNRYEAEYMESGGEGLTLSGMQALGYARIRNLDSDYGRTNRQRKVLSAAIQKLKALLIHPARMIRFAARVLKTVETNMNALEILSLGEKAVLAESVEQTRLPVSGTYRDDGGMFYDVDYAANRNAFIEFVYGGD